MPRLTAIVHPMFGRIPVNTADCPSCGTPAGQTCYLMCPRSPACYTAEQERTDALEAEAEIAQVGFMAWDSAQHRRHGLPCPYDGYDPADAYEDEPAMLPPIVDRDPGDEHREPTVTYVPADTLAPVDDDDLPF